VCGGAPTAGSQRLPVQKSVPPRVRDDGAPLLFAELLPLLAARGVGPHGRARDRRPSETKV